MNPGRKKFAVAASLIAIALLFAWILLMARAVPEDPLPNPNGCDDFVKATALLEPNPPDWWSMQGEELHQALRKLVATNQTALDLVRAGLAKECRMVPWKMNATNGAHLNDLAGAKRLAQAFAAASRLALIEGRTNEAAALAMDCIRYGNDSVRGGVLIDGLVGLAIRNIGLSSLRDTIGGLDIESARKTIAALEGVTAATESYDEIMKRERQWARWGRFGRTGFFTQFIQPFLDRKSLAKARLKFDKSETDIARMEIQLAAHAYELETGKSATAVGELVPQYLKAIPLDPATGVELPLN